MASPATNDVYKSPYATTITYALGLLLFLLPFFDIKCNAITMAQLSGINMATGSKPSVSRDLEKLGNNFGGKGFDENKDVAKTKSGGDGHLFITALAALLLGVAGLLFSLLNKGRNARSTMMIGLLGVVALLASWIEIGAYVKANAKTDANDTGGDFAGMVAISANPTFWFFLCLLCFAASAFIGYKQSNEITTGTPAGAPQVHIDNPGDQSEFPAAPGDDRNLG